MMNNYRDEARALLEHGEKPLKNPPLPKTVKKIRCLAIRGENLNDMQKQAGLTDEEIWQVTSDIDRSQRLNGERQPGGEAEPETLHRYRIREQARTILQNGGNAEAASMKTGLPLTEVNQLGKPLFQPSSSILRGKGPIEGQPSEGDIEGILRENKESSMQKMNPYEGLLLQKMSRTRLEQLLNPKAFKKERKPLPEGSKGTGYSSLAKKVDKSHREIMEKFEIGTLKKIYFKMMRGDTPERISNETLIPAGRIIEILFNPKTQRAVLDASENEITERFGVLPTDPFEVKRNHALLHILAGRIRINSDPAYKQLLKESVPSKLRNFVKI